MLRQENIFFLIILLVIKICTGCSAGADFFIDKSQLEEGDLAFRGGTSIESELVKFADERGLYSHVGIVVKIDSVWKIVHAVPGESSETGGVECIKMDSPEVFFGKDRASCGCFARYDTTYLVRQKSAQEAIRWYEKGILFDNAYLLSDTTKLYCTQLVHLAYKCQGIDLSQGRRSNFPLGKEQVILPSDFTKNKKLLRHYILEKK